MRFESHHPRSNLHVSTTRSLGASRLSAPSVSILSPDALDLDSELTHWKSHWRNVFDSTGLRYNDYEPAIKLGLDAYMRGHGRGLEEMEDELRSCYKRVRGLSRLDWDDARAVVAAAYQRVHLHRHAQ